MEKYNETALLGLRNELRTKIDLALMFPVYYQDEALNENMIFLFKRLLNVNKIYHSCQKLKK